jgi:hypothetical protein
MRRLAPFGGNKVRAYRSFFFRVSYHLTNGGNAAANIFPFLLFSQTINNSLTKIGLLLAFTPIKLNFQAVTI